MRLKFILPTVDLAHESDPAHCPHPGCGGRHVQHHQPVPNPCAIRSSRRRQPIVSGVCAAGTPSESIPWVSAPPTPRPGCAGSP